MPGTTQRPTESNKCISSEESIFSQLDLSPAEFLRRVLSKHPFLKLIPDSLLAQAVIAEYNSSINPTTNRPDWPVDLCGYVEGVRDEAIRDGRGASNPATPDNQLVGRLNSLPDTKYDQDDCIQPVADVSTELGRFGVPLEATLAVRQPGTLQYSRDCETDDLIRDLYDVDWTGYFRTPTYATIEDLTDDEKAQLEEQFGPVFAAAQSGAGAQGVSAGTDVFGSGQFLWKPVSESNGKLVILLPTEYRKRVTGVRVKMKNGTVGIRS